MIERWLINSGFGGFMAGIFGAAIVLLAVIGAAVGTGDYFISKSNCAAFERATGRDTRFVRYNLANWDCLVRASDGKWIPKSQLRDVSP